MAYSSQYRRILNRMEFYQYQEGLIRRYLDQQGAWDSHLERCRNYLLKTIEQNNPDKISILGSGWLLEIPLAEMCEKVKSIDLIDIIHPSDVRKQVSGMKNVRLIEADLSGGLIEQIWNLAGGLFLIKRKIDMGKIRFPEFRFDEDPGLVISLNLLSQLDSLPVKMLRKNARMDENELYEFRKKLQNSHLNLLKKHESVLISDYVEIFTSVKGDITDVRTVVADLPEGKNEEEWTWDFDTCGTDFYRKRSVLKVKAMII